MRRTVGATALLIGLLCSLQVLADGINTRDNNGLRQTKDSPLLALYVGTYPVGYFGKDIGFTSTLFTKWVFIEGTYKLIRNNRDYVLDRLLASDPDFGRDIKYKWDGYRYSVGFKFPLSHNEKLIVTHGPVFRFTKKEFETVTANVSSSSGMGTYSFYPLEKRHELLYDMSFITNTFIAAGGGFGLGLSYNTFSSGESVFHNSDQYQIEDKMLGFRKAKRIGLACYFYLSVGIKIGKVS